MTGTLTPLSFAMLAAIVDHGGALSIRDLLRWFPPSDLLAWHDELQRLLDEDLAIRVPRQSYRYEATLRGAGLVRGHVVPLNWRVAS